MPSPDPAPLAGEVRTGSKDANLLSRSWRFPLVNTTPSGRIYPGTQETSVTGVIRQLASEQIVASPSERICAEIRAEKSLALRCHVLGLSAGPERVGALEKVPCRPRR